MSSRYLRWALGTLLWMAISLPVQAQQQPADAPNASGLETPASGEERVRLDFEDVELAVLINTIARLTGKNFIYDDRVRGRVTIVSPTEVTIDQAYAVFESVLKVKGFTAVPGPAGIMKVIPVRDAKESNLETIMDQRVSRNRDLFVTRLIPLAYIDAESITNTVKGLVSKDASMVAYGPTNTIIITDTAANIQRLLKILAAIDIETHKEELAVIKIRYADAATLAEQVSQIYDTQLVGGSAGKARTSRRSTRQAAKASTTAASQSGRAPVRIITDDRTNSLLVLASRSQLIDIRSLVRQLDVPVVGGGRIHVYYLRHADAEELAQTMNSLLTGQRGSGAGRTGAAGGQPQALRSAITQLAEGITVTADPATNSLVIQASKEAYETVIEVIERLDIARPQVLVEALIMEVDITDNMELGFDGALRYINGSLDLYVQTAAGALTAGAASFPIPGFGDVLTDNTTNNDGTYYTAIIKAAARDANSNILSAPHILTSDNEEA
ncbi:MAG: secretin N-terminal domain-containing protein, partial [Myxococcota bacterium]